MAQDSDYDTRNDWGIIHCIRSEGEDEIHVLRLRIQAVPSGDGKKQIKTALERAGRVFGEGDFQWGNHRILPRDEWLALDQVAAELITYADLLDEAKGEKRVTVRFPIGLHSMLVKAAQGKSFNQFCIDVMAAAVGYEPEPLAPTLPRIARQQGVSEAEMEDKVQTIADRVRPRLSNPLTQKMGASFANLAGLPPEQQKQQIMAVWSDPDFVQRHNDGMREMMSLTEEELAKRLGVGLEEAQKISGDLKMLTADYAERGVNGLKASSPEQVKDNTLLLRDIFSGNIPPKL